MGIVSFKFNKTAFLSFAFLIIGSACSQKGDTKSVEKDLSDKVEVNFDFQDKIDFNYEIRPNFEFSQTLDSHMVAFVNRYSNSIDIYSIEKGSLEKQIVFPTEGPNGLNRLSNFLIKNDTIYCVDSFKYEVVLFDFNGVALKRIKCLSTDYDFSILPRHFSPSQIHKNENKLYVLGDPDINPHSKNYSEGNYMLEIDLTSGNIKQMIAVPEFLTDDRWMVNQYFYKHLYHDDSWLFSFEISENIFAFNELSEVSEYFAGSKYGKSFGKWNRKDLNSESAYKYYLSSTTYGQIIYDQKNELYYRTVRLPNSEAINEQNLDKMWTKGLSIIVLDKNLNRIGETLVEDSRIGGSFISTEKGVYISFFDKNITNDGLRKYVLVKPNLL